ncbi:MAG: type II toxin-antitoxin system RelE/ParE family toxin [Rhodoferax sp.]|jgi:plasmid stabilization system protein ParE|uniref:type II toxin-antitoxin system RelE/ParE family toxin n=1 Tax=Rhodoferax sp. TaxID=50421 RepID=UPI002731EAAA|nr:type II toxin-antitoxin system RelE/ParE family toxin [Rhodoferax sp.]MDP1531568.1 type II toxin-antitoxin system RelE/ParE family toxin [Rhodoferax sp.]MDP1942896.1 type II toxin-antitoxin system RelE/ParE family toxin [Rhodoferax sp.]MDP3189979.1 type II toxin-antitoxin system RelE/ParE family toxin [Rhodoferax sp.]MDP3338388.1 type II toxin-antitoxin system RelE/ParE family toxin [Rhodoferax sp.]
MALQLSELALQSIEEIILYYELEAGLAVADAVERRIFEQIEAIEPCPMSIPESEIFPGARKLVISKLPYVAFVRQIDAQLWEVVDVVHTSRKLPKSAR